MDTYRFFVPDLLPQSSRGQILLPDDQAHHARTVLRLQPGDKITLFDGNGAWANGALSGGAGGGKSKHRPLEITLEQGGIRVDPPPQPALTIAAAIPKGERAEWLVEQISQLNASTLHWLNCDRGVVKPKEGGAKLEKWRRFAIESAKQSHRTHLLHIAPPIPLESLLIPLTTQNPELTTLWLEPRQDGSSKKVADLFAPLQTPPKKILALVGPEGGWSDREHSLLESLAQRGALTRIQLTQTILRIETACAAIAALLMSR